MCRIAGIVAEGANNQETLNKVTLMCDALKHGGPDDMGTFTAKDTHLVFGHRRLSVIDLSKRGHQPMADVNKKAWITFNGEIYNYLQLKDELVKAKAAFHSDTDTEVILQAYLHWGTAAFAKLRGMFAFALYDTTNGLTYLVRDTTGIKPIYYHIAGSRLSFASEVNALRSAGIATEVDKQWPIKFLAFGHLPEPYTDLKDVYSLPKGQMLCWDTHNNTYTIRPYCTHNPTEYITDVNEAHQIVHNALKLAVNRNLIADATIGVFLSGGIDSSLITLLADQQKHKQLNTVSIFFNEKSYDESAYQQQVFEKIEGEKFTHLVKQQDFNELFPEIINAMDIPTTDGVNTWFISKYARQDGLKAVLSGVGADELFGGYPSFNRVRYIRYLRTLPTPLLNASKYITSDRYKRLSFLSRVHPLADYLFLRGFYSPTEIAELLDCEEKEVFEVLFSPSPSPGSGLSDQERASWFETNLYMQNQLLRDTDVMSMSHGLEVRVPFLDEDLRVAANSIASGIRFNKHQPKKILIDSFKDILPASVWDRPKMGFSFPLQKWMREHPEISNEAFYKGKKAKSIINNFKADKVHWSKAFALYQIQNV